MTVTRFFRAFGISVLATALVACSAQPKQQRAPVRPVVTQAEPTVTETDTIADTLAAAKQAWLEGDTLLANRYLLDLTDDYLSAGNITEARQILLTLRERGIPEQQRNQADLLTVAAYIHDPSVKPSALLPLLEGRDLQGKWAPRKQQLLRQLYLSTGQWLAAANTQLMLDSTSPDVVKSVWEWTNQASEAERRSAEQDYPLLRPYLALYNLLATTGTKQEEAAQALEQYKQVYRSHPLTLALPGLVTDPATLVQPDIDKLAILLPLSGRFEDTGTVVKDGILAAYYAQLEAGSSRRALPTLRFIDTQDKSAEQLLSEIGETRWLIGPLLKDTLDILLPVLPPSVTMLALNRTDEVQQNEIPDALTGQHLFFSLAPEDEAYQLADLVFSKGYRAPIVVASQSSLYQRMHDAFSERWSVLSARTTGDRPNLTTVTFSDTASLRDGITRALDVAQSNERIQQIKYMINEEVYDMPRNRQDIDAVVVFASPQHTELLNPMIEASLLPADNSRVPVYATSRSMDYDSGKNQWRDLENVRFIDMPWMLPNPPWRTLAQQATTIWPNRLTAARRLFAFGVDAYNLLPYVANLKAFPQSSVDGLTGTLTLDRDGNITRHLPTAIIRNERIQQTGE
ncbi:penicillin-binding protein activator [Alteromonas sp. CYL-A6]|uniref:penicillin-binding protein activator n=1 Tax=Alteromonas nitratireducens TaxID=3390813 RepID=UPI0034B28EF3